MGELELVNGNKQALTLSEQQSIVQTNVLLGTEMAAMKAAYINQDLPEGTPDVMMQDWKVLIAEFGEKKFKLALLKARQHCKFFPTTAEIREFCVAVSRESRHQWAADKDCELCHGSSWENIGKAVRRCKCYKQRA
jgi:hypothetical protein